VWQRAGKMIYPDIAIGDEKRKKFGADSLKNIKLKRTERKSSRTISSLKEKSTKNAKNIFIA
jgi:hypothetical protein